MVGEIVDILADKPEKIEKAILRGIKIILNILIATLLYRVIIGNFKILPISDYEGLIDFVLSGKILVCFFFYLISNSIIFPILDVIALLPIFLLNKIPGSIEKKDVFSVLKMLGIISISKHSPIPVPGKNIHILEEFLKAFTEDDAEDSTRALKDSFINNIWNLYFTFFILYLILIRQYISSTLLFWIIFLGVIIVPICYNLIVRLFDYMLKHYSQILKEVEFIKSVDLTNTIFKSYNISLEDGPDDLEKFKVFYKNEKQYVVAIGRHYRKDFREEELKHLLIRKRKPGRVFLIIGHASSMNFSNELLLEFHDSLIPIQYSDEKNMGKQLRQTIETIIH